jgi:hypothetical protein
MEIFYQLYSYPLTYFLIFYCNPRLTIHNIR